MRRLDIKPTEIKEALNGKVPPPEHIGQVIDEDVVVFVDDKPVLLYLVLPESDVRGVREVATTAKMSKSARVNGVPTKSCVFGAMPASPSRTSCFCRFSRATHEQSRYLDRIRAYNKLVNGVYQEHFPDHYQADLKWVEDNVHQDWRWMPGPYQTFNVNTNFAIPYHTDKGNVNGSLSNVLILSRGIEGGELVCPELKITLSQRDRAFTLFTGGDIVHGVRPIKYRSSKSYRSSMVLYTLKGMRTCSGRDEELTKTKAMLTKRAAMTTEERKNKVREMNKGVLKKGSK